MATYLQGVTDYIPEYQPFQPDFNFYGNYLQTKQNQYDSNYKALNNLYGQYFYADLTREPNIQKKDKLLKQIDFNLNICYCCGYVWYPDCRKRKPFIEQSFIV